MVHHRPRNCNLSVVIKVIAVASFCNIFLFEVNGISIAMQALQHTDCYFIFFFLAYYMLFSEYTVSLNLSV